VPTYGLHDTTGDDLGTVEHPAPNVEPGDLTSALTATPTPSSGARKT
jgi:hypothetical protein